MSKKQNQLVVSGKERSGSQIQGNLQGNMEDWQDQDWECRLAEDQ